MIIIYDFDGTLTPFSLPQYEILKKNGYTDDSLMERVKEEFKTGNTKSLYDANYKVFFDILEENRIEPTEYNICKGSENTIFNKGVIEFFERFQSSITGIKHYIVTSGIQSYVEKTKIAKYVDGIYGVTFENIDGKYSNVKYLLTDELKVDVIKKLQEINKTNEVIYFGDGLTDRFAFEYVHRIGGKSIFIATNEESKSIYKKLNAEGLIDKFFEADFSENSDIWNFIKMYI